MAPTSILTTILAVTIIAISDIPTTEAVGPSCYECNQLAHTRDCRRIVQCGEHEKCSAEMLVTSDGITYFRSGCKSANLCRSAGKRADSTICTECCTGDFCNVQLCDKPVVLKKRCFTCDDVINPSDCNLVSSCDQDQVCYTEKIFVNKEMRYRLGCTRNNTCTTKLPNLFGKRQNQPAHPGLPSIPYCGECCSGLYCNRGLCPNGIAAGSLHLAHPPQDVFCDDYDSHACTTLNHHNFCGDHNVRNFLCRRTCGICSGKPFVPSGSSPTVPPVTSTTITSTTKIPAVTDACHDDGVNCVDPEIKKLVCKIDPTQCKRSCGLCDVSTTVMSTSTAVPSTTPARHICDDPITECQCKYLDREIDLCNDPDHTGNTFCCYYCKQKLHPTRYMCPDPFCKRAEHHEFDRVQGMNITCHDKQTH